jgi:hypothetical protein
LIVLFKNLGYLVFGDAPIGPFVWCAFGAHETPRTPNALNPLLAGVFPEIRQWRGEIGVITYRMGYGVLWVSETSRRMARSDGSLCKPSPPCQFQSFD